MHHAFADKYSGIDSFIHGLDPRSKIAGLFAFVLFVVFTPPSSYISFLCFLALLSLLILFSKIPVVQLLRRLFIVIPFVLMAAIFIPFFKEGRVMGSFSAGPVSLHVTYDGLLILWGVFIKSSLCTLAMALLFMSTNFTSLLKAFEKLHVPPIFVMMISFMYRYIFVIEDEFMKLRIAKESRTFGGSAWFHTKAYASMLGVMFLRSYERGENVYLAMCARGFDGSIKTLSHLHFHVVDYIFIAATLAALTLIRSLT